MTVTPEHLSEIEVVDLYRSQDHVTSMTDVPDWRIYERVAACFEMVEAGMDVSVTPNASLIGSVSGVARQIDVLVEARWDEGVERRIIFDAKLRRRKVDVKDV